MNNKKAYYEFTLFSSLTVIDRIHVPLFLMISGALLFRKNEEWGVVFKKRFLRIYFVTYIIKKYTILRQVL